MPDVIAAVWDPTGMSFIAHLPDAFDIQWQDVLDDLGMGKLTLAMNDSAAQYMIYGNLIKLAYRTNMYAFTFRIESVTWVRISGDEEFGQVVEVSGRGKGVKFSDTLVYPPKGVLQIPSVETRSISFASPEFDDSGWVNAGMMAAYGDMTAPWRVVQDGELVAAPPGWPGPEHLGYSSYWIWEPGASEAAGNVYFRQNFYIGTAQEVTIIATADNFYTVYLDGVAILGDNSFIDCWKEYRRWKSLLPAGAHNIAAVVNNYVASPAGFLCAVFIEHDPICDDADPPNCVEQTPTVILVSDGYWKCLAFPDQEPGFSPASFIIQLYNEARQRGELLDVELSFTAALDSANQAWDVMPEVGANIGDSMLDVLENLTKGFWIDWWFDPAEYGAGGIGGDPFPPTGPTGPPPDPPVPPAPVITAAWRPAMGLSNSHEWPMLEWTCDEYGNCTYDVQEWNGASWDTLATGIHSGTLGNMYVPPPAGWAPPIYGAACWGSQTVNALTMRVRSAWTPIGYIDAVVSAWVEATIDAWEEPTAPTPPEPPDAPADPEIQSTQRPPQGLASLTDYGLIAWTDPDAGGIGGLPWYDVQQLINGSWVFLSTMQLGGNVGNYAAQQYPAGWVTPSNGGACWSNYTPLPNLITMRVRAGWIPAGETVPAYSNWLDVTPF